MRTITFLIALFFCIVSFAQPARKGVVIKKFPSSRPIPDNPTGFITKPDPHEVGDTLIIRGMTTSVQMGSVLLFQDGPVQEFVQADRVKLLESKLPFWEEAWFSRRASMELKGKQPLTAMASLDQATMTYVSELYENSLIVEDALLNDYLQEMLFRIFPDSLIKTRPRSLHIWLLHSLHPRIFSLDNGAVILTTGMLCEVRSEWELENALARQVAHIVLDHQLANFLQYTDPFPEIKPDKEARAIAGEYFSYNRNGNQAHWQDVPLPQESLRKALGAAFTTNQKYTAHLIARDYMALTYPDGPPEITAATSHRFTLMRSAALMRNAWKLYDLRRLAEAAPLVDSLIVTGAATGEAYLLRAKIQRMQFNSPEHNRQALAWLKIAREKDVSGLPEIEREMALLWLRLNEKSTARQALEQYIDRMQAMDAAGFATDITWAREMILKLEKI